MREKSDVCIATEDVFFLHQPPYDLTHLKCLLPDRSPRSHRSDLQPTQLGVPAPLPPLPRSIRVVSQTLFSDSNPFILSLSHFSTIGVSRFLCTHVSGDQRQGARQSRSGVKFAPSICADRHHQIGRQTHSIALPLVAIARHSLHIQRYRSAGDATLLRHASTQARCDAIIIRSRATCDALAGGGGLASF